MPSTSHILQRDIYAFDFSYCAGVYKTDEARGAKVDKKIGEIERLLKSKRDEILEIAARHGAVNVRIFGSGSRGEAGEESDIDLLVDVGPGRSGGDLAHRRKRRCRQRARLRLCCQRGG